MPDAKVWLHRNPNYFVSASWGARKMGTFVPYAETGHNPYLTLTVQGILPADVEDLINVDPTMGKEIATFELSDKRRCALVCMDNSVLWVSPVGLRPVAVENDPMSGNSRSIVGQNFSRTVPSRSGGESFTIASDWVNIDDQFVLICPGGFRYVPAKGFNNRSAAYDQIVPLSQLAAWQMIPKVTASETQQLATLFHASMKENKAEIELQDRLKGRIRRIAIPLVDR
jgi:hypothetical protein